VAIRITVWILRLFSGFVTGRYGATLQCWACIAGIAVATMTSLRHWPLADVCTVPVLLVIIITFMFYILHGVKQKEQKLQIVRKELRRSVVIFHLLICI